MSSSKDKLKEAKAEFKRGKSYVTLGFSRWSKDHIMAAPCFQKAARLYRRCGDDANANSSAEMAFSSYLGCQQFFKAGNMALELEKYYGEKNDADLQIAWLTKAVDAQLEADQQHIAASNVKRLASLYVKKGDPDAAVERLTDIADRQKHEGRPASVYDVLKEIFRIRVDAQQNDEAIQLIRDRMRPTLQQLDSGQDRLRKCTLMEVILHLARPNSEAADQCFLDGMDVPGFTMSREAEASEALLNAWREHDDEAWKEACKIVQRSNIEGCVYRTVKKLVPSDFALEGEVDIGDLAKTLNLDAASPSNTTSESDTNNITAVADATVGGALKLAETNAMPTTDKVKNVPTTNSEKDDTNSGTEKSDEGTAAEEDNTLNDIQATLNSIENNKNEEDDNIDLDDLLA
eukprot:g739.t1